MARERSNRNKTAADLEGGQFLAELARADEIPLLRANGVEAHRARSINDEERGLLAERNHSARDVVGVKDGAVGIGKDGEWIGVLGEMVDELIDRMRGDRHNRGAGFCQFGVGVAQLREMPAAKRSEKASKEDEDDGPVSASVVQVPGGGLA